MIDILFLVDHRAAVTLEDGRRVETELKQVGPFLAEYDISVTALDRDGSVLWATSLDDHGGARRVALYACDDGSLTVVSPNGGRACPNIPPKWGNRDVHRGNCTEDSAYDPEDAEAFYPIKLDRGYLGAFEFNRWKGPDGTGQQLWRWMFHPAPLLPECLRDIGG